MNGTHIKVVFVGYLCSSCEEEMRWKVSSYKWCLCTHLSMLWAQTLWGKHHLQTEKVCPCPCCLCVLDDGLLCGCMQGTAKNTVGWGITSAPSPSTRWPLCHRRTERGGGRHGPDSHITVETEAQSNNRRHSTGRYVPAKPWSTLQCRHPRIEKKVLGLLTDNFPYLSSEH